jgi:hypothetical protein
MKPKFLTKAYRGIMLHLGCDCGVVVVVVVVVVVFFFFFSKFG